MSSKPSEDGVRQLRFALRKFRDLSKRLAELKSATKEIPTVEEELQSKHREIMEMLECMDVATRGNFGWEGRAVWMLAKLEELSSGDD